MKQDWQEKSSTKILTSPDTRVLITTKKLPRTTIKVLNETNTMINNGAILEIALEHNAQPIQVIDERNGP